MLWDDEVMYEYWPRAPSGSLARPARWQRFLRTQRPGLGARLPSPANSAGLPNCSQKRMKITRATALSRRCPTRKASVGCLARQAEPGTSELLAITVERATAHAPEGLAVSSAPTSPFPPTLLHNGLGNFDSAFAAANLSLA